MHPDAAAAPHFMMVANLIMYRSFIVWSCHYSMMSMMIVRDLHSVLQNPLSISILNSLKSKMLKVLGLDSALLKGCNSKLKLSFMPIVKVQHFAGLLILHLVNGPTLKDSESLSLSI